MKNAERIPKKHLDLGQILDNSKLFPNQPCIYYLLDQSNDVMYVGQTTNLYLQLLNHKRAGKNFAQFSFFLCEEEDMDRLEKEAIAKFNPVFNQPPVAPSVSSYLSKSLICLKHNITPVAFDYLRDNFGLEAVRSFGNTKYYKPEDVEVWLKRFKGLVVRGRHVLQYTPNYLAVGISSRTKQIQLYKER